VKVCGVPGASRIARSEGEAIEDCLRQERVKLAMQAGRRVRVEDHFLRSDFEYDQTSGAVSRPIEEEKGCRWIQHGATIHGGNSGGPQLAEDGTVVGINTLKREGVSGIQLSLSLPQLREEINRHVPGLVWK
jgi:hypothetical protein